jgi:hypothetical protein
VETALRIVPLETLVRHSVDLRRGFETESIREAATHRIVNDMSELYFVHIDSVGPPLDLDQAVARAASLDLNARAATKILKKATGPYVECALRFKANHPDADRLDELTPGFLHLLLRDTIPAVARVTDEDIWARYAKRRSTSFEKSGCVYRVDETSAEQLRLTILCPADGAPDPNLAWNSHAWVPDREVMKIVPATQHVDLRWYPAPGLGGADLKSTELTPFRTIGKTFRVQDFAFLAGEVYAVSNRGGHVAKVDGKNSSKKVGAPDKGCDAYPGHADCAGVTA